MYAETLRALRSEVSGEATLRNVARIIQHHRIQASPGLRAAAEEAAGWLRDAGLEVELLRYPARYDVSYWGHDQFDEWSCRGARLSLIRPEVEAQILADYGFDKLSIIQRSCPTPPGGVTAKLVLVQGGSEPADYEGLPIEGSVVFADAPLERVRQLAVEQRGAIGIVTDRLNEVPGLRMRADMADWRQYTSFWWNGREKPAFGFVLTPRQGDALRALMRREAGAGRAVEVHAEVDTTLGPGELEVVSALLPGETDEEVVVVGHLCHPQWCANDNASGAGTVVETARALARLVREGRLPRPKRSIRFLLPPEMSGTYCYLASHEDEIQKMVAAINLDMVGESQELCGSTMVIESPAESTASYTPVLLARILDDIERAEGFPNLGGSGTLPTFRSRVTPFSGGSDHYIFSDPTVGVPCPMLIQWPDRFYHTNQDTLDKVDPDSLRRAALLTGTYAYAIANAGPAAASWLLAELGADFRARLTAAVAERLRRAEDEGADAVAGTANALRGWISYQVDRHLAAARSIARLAPEVEGELSAVEADARRQAEAELGRIERRTAGNGAATNRERPAPADELRRVVPKRRFPGPIEGRYLQKHLPPEAREALGQLDAEHHVGRGFATLALYWMDGSRTLAEVAELVELETGKRDDDYLLAWSRLVSETDALELVTAP